MTWEQSFIKRRREQNCYWESPSFYCYCSDLSMGNKDDLRNYAKLQKSPRNPIETNSDKRWRKQRRLRGSTPNLPVLQKIRFKKNGREIAKEQNKNMSDLKTVGLHASMNVVGHMAVKKPCSWVISKQLNGLKCPRKEIIHIFSVGLIYLRKWKEKKSRKKM